MTPLKIAFSGPNGEDKTSAFMDLGSLLAKKGIHVYHSFSVLLDELPLDTASMTPEFMREVWTAQIDMEKRAASKEAEVVILGSSLMDVLCYSAWYRTRPLGRDWTWMRDAMSFFRSDGVYGYDQIYLTGESRESIDYGMTDEREAWRSEMEVLFHHMWMSFFMLKHVRKERVPWSRYWSHLAEAVDEIKAMLRDGEGGAR
ncbi:MAG: hypothetical protein LBR80_04685 [Deltaproteobacteria bacterium]|jgi:hypothetical protein|nr:hypothetical protein [Deltaproteobacteria bacterium]